MKIGELPMDMQSLLGQIAMDSGKIRFRDREDGERFKEIDLPLEMVPLTKFPAVIPGQHPEDERRFEDYLDTPIEEFPPVVVAHGYWIDGRHRVWAARVYNAESIQTIDASRIFGKKDIKRWKFLGRMRT